MPKIALIGAGSVVFAQKLVSDILQRKRIGTPEFRLMDINPERLRIAGIAAEKTALALGSKATVRTTDKVRKDRAARGSKQKEKDGADALAEE